MTISCLTEIRFKYASLAIFACCLAVVSIRSLAQAPVSASVRSTDEHQLPAPFQASLPSIYIAGDSTASYHPDRDHEGMPHRRIGVFFSGIFRSEQGQRRQSCAWRPFQPHIHDGGSVGQGCRTVVAQRHSSDTAWAK
jgi:hypothetical protein